MGGGYWDRNGEGGRPKGMKLGGGDRRARTNDEQQP